MDKADGGDRGGGDRGGGDEDGERLEHAAIAAPDGVKTTYADIAMVIDRGETVHVLLCLEREDPETGDTIRQAERWVVFPRSGFLASLFSAMDQFVAGGTAPAAGCGRKPSLN